MERVAAGPWWQGGRGRAIRNQCPRMGARGSDAARVRGTCEVSVAILEDVAFIFLFSLCLFAREVSRFHKHPLRLLEGSREAMKATKANRQAH